MRIILTMVPVYGYLVLSGSAVLDPKDRKKGQRLVPARYVDLVCEWLAEHQESEEPEE